MAQPFDPEADSISVSLCENCPHIHLNVQKDGQRISMALDEKDWEFLIVEYQKMVIQRTMRVEGGQSIN